MSNLEQVNMEEVYKEFDQCVEIFNRPDPSLSMLFDKPDLKAWKATAPDGSGLLLKMEFIFDMELEEFFKMIVVNENRHLWDNKFHNYEVIKTFGPGDALIYYAIKTPFMVTTRDMLARRQIIQNYRGYDYMIKINSQQSELRPPLKGYVRGSLNGSFVGIKKLENGRILVQNRFALSLGGSIPVMILSSMSSNIPKELYDQTIEGLKILKKKGLI